VSGLAVAMGLRNPTVACASPWEKDGDAGVFVGLRFGNPHRPIAATIGLEVRGVLIDPGFACDGRRQDFAGAVARIELIGWQSVRLTLGPVVGNTNGLSGYAAEVTAGIERGTDPGLVVQLAAEASGLFLLNARGGYAFGRDGHVSVGARIPPLSSSAFCVTGRPLRRNEARAPVAGAQWTAQVVDRISNERAARVWTERACHEWASVPAFCELAQQLKASGAPQVLIARAREAAADELRHAAISAQTAAALAVAPALGLDPPVGSHRAVASGRAGIVRLAVESYLDGCIAEGTAAAVAAREADRADDSDIATMQRTIASDEARHAELAWDILEWTLAVQPEAVCTALTGIRAASAETRRDDGSGPGEGGPMLERFGILDSARVHAVATEERGRAAARLAARLAA